MFRFAKSAAGCWVVASLAACAQSPELSADLVAKLRGLSTNQSEGEIEDRRTEKTVSEADYNAPSRLTTLAPGKLELDATEFDSIDRMAKEVANFEETQAAEFVLGTGKSRDGLIRVIKMLHLMPQQARAKILNLLRPAEIRTIFDHPVERRGRDNRVYEPRPSGPPGGDPAISPVTGTVPPTDGSGRLHGAGRFQLAGVGNSAWMTVLDTATGVVYNYREIHGEKRWVPITIPLLDGKN